MSSINFRPVKPSDCDLLFNWANDPITRKNSYNSNEINYNDHVLWFNKNISDNWYIFYDELNSPVGIVRFDFKNNEWIIGISVDANHRGKGYASEMIELAVNNFINKSSVLKISAYIKEENLISKKSFNKAGFVDDSMVSINNHPSYKMIFFKN
jgi:RimJ/RimL family protein N-acetyltransferase